MCCLIGEVRTAWSMEPRILSEPWSWTDQTARLRISSSQLQRKGRCPSRLAVASVRRDFLETMTFLHDRRLIDGGWKAGKPSYRWPCKGADRPQAKERRKIGDEAWSKRRPNSRWYFPSERERRRAAQNEGMLAVNERRRQLTVHSKCDLS